MAVRDEATKCIGVLVGETGGEALICHVEEGKVSLLEHQLRELLPLGLSRVNTSGVVSTGMQEDHTAIRGGLHNDIM
jgi:hypothetical protein